MEFKKSNLMLRVEKENGGRDIKEDIFKKYFEARTPFWLMSKELNISFGTIVSWNGKMGFRRRGDDGKVSKA